MSSRRPINRRPWRRPPWRKSNRPKRWISLNSGVTIDSSSFLVEPWSAAGPGDAAPVVTLAAGQVDVEPWADNQEVTIDRIVGQINLQGVAYQTFTEVPALATAPATIIRLGMMVQEEADATSSPLLSLFSDEVLEDYEWMWLREVVPSNWNYGASTTPDLQGWGFTESIHIDSGLRRKLGQTDNLLLYCNSGTVTGSGVETQAVFVTGSHLLRSIFMSK